MTDAEFADEIARRLNRFLELDKIRANATLSSSLAHVGYANVAHFLGQLSLPHGMGGDTPAEAMMDVKFLIPILDSETRGIKGFESVTGRQLQEKALRQSPEGFSESL